MRRNSPSGPDILDTRGATGRMLRQLFPLATRARMAAAVAISIGAAAWLGLSPSSPIALGIADVQLGVGHVASAAARYDAIAAVASDEVARRALSRSATVWSADLGDDATAQVRLERLAAITASPDALGEVYARLGRIHESARAVEEAAEAYQAGFQADSSREDLLGRAARLRLEAGHYAAAEALYERLAKKAGPRKAEAHLGQAQALLALGRAQDALMHFSAARDLARDASLAATARLGASTCYERLGDLDGALAEIDAAELPSSVRTTRAEGIAHRAALASGSL